MTVTFTSLFGKFLFVTHYRSARKMGQGFSAPQDVQELHPMIQREYWSKRTKQKILNLYEKYGNQLHSYEVSWGGRTLLEQATFTDNLDGVDLLLGQCHAEIEVSSRWVKKVSASYTVHAIQSNADLSHSSMCSFLLLQFHVLFLAGQFGSIEMIKLLFGKYRHKHKDIRHNLVRIRNIMYILSRDLYE